MGSLSRISFVPGRSKEFSNWVGDDLKEERRKDDRNQQTDDSETGFGGKWVTPVADGMNLEWKEMLPSGPGFRNMGNTCFMNASLQCLLHTPPLARVLAQKMHSRHLSKHHKGVGGFCSFCAFEDLYPQVHNSSRDKRVVTPTSFVQNQRVICRTFKPGRQEDAHEFVRHVLDGMVKSSLRSSGRKGMDRKHNHMDEMRSIVHNMFGGCLQNSVTCMKCKAVSVVSEPFLDLSLDIYNSNTVASALEKFTAVERLDGSNKYRCDKCKSYVSALKRMTIRRAPNVLTLHLKRFDHLRKNSKHVAYGERLNLEDYMIGCPAKTSARYRLIGVLIHEGSSMHVGHYYSYVRNANGTWSLKDDESSSHVGASSVLKQNAYLLFYVRESRNEPNQGEQRPGKQGGRTDLPPQTQQKLGFSPTSENSSQSSESFYSDNSFSDHSLTPPYESGDKGEALDQSEGTDDSSSCKSTSSSELVKGHTSSNSKTGVRNSAGGEALQSKLSDDRDPDTTSGFAKESLSNGVSEQHDDGTKRSSDNERTGSKLAKRNSLETGHKAFRKTVSNSLLSMMSLSNRSYLRLQIAAYAARLRHRTERKPALESKKRNVDQNEDSAGSAETAETAQAPLEVSANGPSSPARTQPNPTEGGQGVVFPEARTWEDLKDEDVNESRSILESNRVSTRFQKRERHGDEYDADYDRGKQKKQKNKRENSNPRSSRSSAFDAFAKRKFTKRRP
mmetsp:Transcript_44398/g.172551  ORF Transcript_44398/g.172551 Transcript_44398/m.172551 type:complete len:729 (-) Transcript_44398:654-2840(-)|eukprot:CAMPEP_0113956108 /NCGR_PEP_ID=MMETSP0011_2-20120614/1846_1 /TAXON_ID=101924 /ORGANISM="Rhodosorus marinus" /LENGTH=728 /DNA_ID=CAMNT_0000966153 /DNA_START=254 /DNA_END=2440 /DNA_ORIENTATION=- /assembly_acc=CAM_ASM_000156